MKQKNHRLIASSIALLALDILLSGCVLGIKKTVTTKEHDEISTMLNSSETSTDATENFKGPENRENNSKLDKKLTESIAEQKTFI